MPSGPGDNPVRRAGLNWLALTALVVLVASLVHNLDHIFNQPGGEAWPPIGVAGAMGYVATGGTLWLALRRDPLAPLAGLFTGLATVIGFSAIHLAPEWSALSDPYAEAGVDWVSYAIVYYGIGAGLALAVMGVSELFGRRVRGVGAGAT